MAGVQILLSKTREMTTSAKAIKTLKTVMATSKAENLNLSVHMKEATERTVKTTKEET